MDSLSKLQLGCSRINNTEQWDDDAKVNMIYSDVKYWCDEFLKLDKNIQETSISKGDKLVRKKELIKKIFTIK